MKNTYPFFADKKTILYFVVNKFYKIVVKKHAFFVQYILDIVGNL